MEQNTCNLETSWCHVVKSMQLGRFKSWFFGRQKDVYHHITSPYKGACNIVLIRRCMEHNIVFFVGDS